MQQQAAIMAAAGGYVPMAAALAAQLPGQVQMSNGLASPALTPTSGHSMHFLFINITETED